MNSDANQFGHIVDDRLRGILINESECEDDVCFALTCTQKALQDDMSNEDLDPTVLDARLQAYNDASDWWNEEGNSFRAIKALKECWLV